MKSATALLALTVVANASPISKISKREGEGEWPWSTKESLCQNKAWLLRTAKGAEQVWDETGAGDELDRQLMAQWEHQKNWLTNMENEATGGVKGKFSMGGCGVIGGECSVMGIHDCEEQFDKYGTKADGSENPIGKVSYWIFQAVKGMQNKFTILRNKLVEETIVTNLLIGEMVEAFQGNEEHTEEVFKWLSAAIGLGSTVGGLIPGAGEGISTGLDIMGGIFDIIAEETKPEEIDQGTISSALADLFTKTSSQIDKTMRLATGVIDETKGETVETIDTLPSVNKYGPWIHNQVTRFFNGGWFLLDDTSKPVDVLINSITGSIKPKIANNVMKAAGLRLVADKRIANQEDCGYATGRQWMKLKDSQEYCFYIMRHKPQGMHGETWAEATEDVYVNMAKYNLQLRDPYYRAIVDCATSGQDGLDLANLGFNNIPVCFFNLEAFFIEHNDGPECNSNMINKVCNPIKATPIS
ncbi:uncharacterized protein FIESC28_05534 [Fusarium coffeatum]|uniref:Uncharacterized protein n=1 Tax=Fusarium coffeatum TaxID=231269 RepID=A0A366RQZ5_9HYPO|nr:uncharacterized protein FIESC28_05534 [Fusarium coffeatum]RBR19539.1 hypothetical protein FIESC28_05534 [Fusarium coffeatum]